MDTPFELISDPQSSMDRRRFLKVFAGGTLGAALSYTVLADAEGWVAEKTYEATGRPIGNASEAEKLGATCGGQTEDKAIAQCYLDQIDTGSYFAFTSVVAPISEEITFRGLTSKIVDRGLPDKEVGRNIVLGTDHLGFSRRELIAGAVSSVLFGFAHNITNSGLNTQTLPTPQIICGAYFWGIARKFGLPASMAAHGMLNLGNTRRSVAYLKNYIQRR